MNKWMYRLAFLTILAAQIMMGITAFWLLYPYEPMTFVEPVPVSSEIFYRGGSVTYTVDYCLTGDYPILINRRLVGIIEYPFSAVSTNSDRGCNVVTYQTPPIPDGIPSGEYRLRLMGTYEVNPIRKITVVMYTVPFNIE